MYVNMKKRCPLCKREVPWLLYHMHSPVDEMLVPILKGDYPGWSEDDGICIPCLEKYKRYHVPEYVDVCMN